MGRFCFEYAKKGSPLVIVYRNAGETVFSLGLINCLCQKSVTFPYLNCVTDCRQNLVHYTYRIFLKPTLIPQWSISDNVIHAVMEISRNVISFLVISLFMQN